MGRMGYPMAERLLKAGNTVSIWNRTRAKAEPLAKLGGRVVNSPADLAGSEHPPPALIEHRLQRVESQPNRRFVDHHQALLALSHTGNPLPVPRFKNSCTGPGCVERGSVSAPLLVRRRFRDHGAPICAESAP